MNGLRPRHILVWADAFEPGFRAGGPIRSVATFVETAPDDVRITLVTRDRDLGMNHAYAGLSGRWVDRGRHRVFYLNTRSPGQWWSLAHAVRQVRFETVYVNSFWSPLFSLLPTVASRLRLIRAGRILVAPRGELSHGASSIKARKKRLAMHAWRPWFAHRSVVWHATSQGEAAEIAAIFPRASVYMVPNELPFPDRPLPPLPLHPGPLRLAFISRIAPKKNLLGLLEALCRVRGELTLDVYGPIDDARYWRTCLRVISQLPPQVSVSHRGELPHAEVAEAFYRYDAFCLPTLGENFGHVIAESLASACPVICTDLTPWTPVLRDGGGYVLDSPEMPDIANGLQEWIDLSPAERHARRLAAHNAFMRWAATRERVSVLERVGPSVGGCPAARLPHTGVRAALHRRPTRKPDQRRRTTAMHSSRSGGHHPDHT